MNTNNSIMKTLTTVAALIAAPFAYATYPGENGKLVFPHIIIYDSQINLAVMNPDGTALVDVSTTLGQSADPAWSPGGKRIAFIRGRACCYWNIWLMNADGSEQTQLTNSIYADRKPTWSPDGNKLAFYRATNPTQIYMINADGSGEHNITNSSSNNSHPAWSPKGDRIVFISERDGNRKVYIMNVNGTQQFRLTNTPGIEDEPQWSPDGNKIVFMTDRDGNNEIYIMNADGSKQSRLTNNPANDHTPAWSPDGMQIVFTRGYGQEGRIYLMNSDGSMQKQISSAAGADPDWQPVPHKIFPQLLSLGDTNQDTTPEIAAITHDATRLRTIATIKDAKTGALVKTIAFNGRYAPIKANVVNDLNGNGAPEIAVLGVNNSNQSVQAEVRDSLTGFKLSAVPFTSPWQTLDIALIRNFSGAGSAALAVLQQTDTGPVVLLANAKTGDFIGWIAFSIGYNGIDLIAINDLNGNKTKELVVLLDNTKPNGSDSVEIRDSSDGQLLHSIAYGGSVPKQLLSIADVNNNGAQELAILRTNSPRIAVKDAQTGLAVNTLNYSFKQPYKLVGVTDDVSAVTDIAMLGHSASGQIRADVRSVLTDSLVGKVVFDTYGTTVGFISIPDINSNGVAELVRLREQPGPQKLFAEVRDGRTGEWLQGMYF